MRKDEKQNERERKTGKERTREKKRRDIEKWRMKNRRISKRAGRD